MYHLNYMVIAQYVECIPAEYKRVLEGHDSVVIGGNAAISLQRKQKYNKLALSDLNL